MEEESKKEDKEEGEEGKEDAQDATINIVVVQQESSFDAICRLIADAFKAVLVVLVGLIIFAKIFL